MKKGSKIYIEGQLQTRKWQDPQGQDRYSTEVVLQNFNGTLVMLDRAGGGGGGFGADDGGGSDFGSSSASGRSIAPPRQPAMASVGKREDMDDEIPF